MHSFHEIEAHELKKFMQENNTLLIDVRNDDEVAKGIINGALHLPLATLPSDYESLLKAENIIFYCHSGVRSAHAAAFIASKGYENAYNLVGGVLAWAKAGENFVDK